MTGAFATTADATDRGLTQGGAGCHMPAIPTNGEADMPYMFHDTPSQTAWLRGAEYAGMWLPSIRLAKQDLDELSYTFDAPEWTDHDGGETAA